MNNIIHHLCGQKFLLHHGTMLKKLLDHVISKNIHHQSICIDHDFFKDTLPVVTVCGWDLLLEESRALLVTSKLNDSAKHILQEC